MAKRKFLRLGYIVVLLWPCFEAACWIIGARPFEQVAYEILSKPQNCIVADSLYGFRLEPGSYEVRINKGLLYRASHDDFGRRTLTKTAEGDSLKKLTFFGCSYTYGMGVNNDESFPSLVAGAFPEFNMENRAVPGYGTLQGFLQLKDLIKEGDIPDVAVFCYAGFHDQRNSMSPYYRRDLRLGYLGSSESIKEEMGYSRFPFGVLDGKGVNIQYIHWNEISFWERLRMHLASVNIVLSIKERLTEQRLPMKEVTLALFEEIKEICDANDIEMLVFGVMSDSETHETLEELEKRSIPATCTEVDLTDSLFNNLPYDSHPNASAHRLMSVELQSLLSEQLAK